MPTKPTFSHVHNQTVASATWTVTHGLAGKPSVGVQVVHESVLQTIIPNSITYPDLNTVVIGFTTPYAGSARLV